MEIFRGESLPLLFAHRGYSSIAPENTLAAFSEALVRKIPGIEFDIHLCKSGELVVTHDDNLKRVTGHDAAVEDCDWELIRKLDAGSWKDSRFKGERIPLLEDVFALCGDSVYYDIEIKTRSHSSTGIEKPLLELIRKHGLQKRCIVSSFNPIPIRDFKRIEAGIPTAIIYSTDKEVPWFLRRGQGRWIASADILKPDRKLVGPVSALWNRLPGKRPVLAWTVDDPADAALLLKRGVKGIISNDPGSLGLREDL